MKMTDSAFFHDYTVDYSDVDEKKTLRPSHLLDFLQSLAVMHSDYIGFDLDYFEQNHQVWMLINYHITIERWPAEGEILKISTWSDKYGRVRANRNFAVADEEGREICYAASRWVLVDLDKRRPAKPKPDFIEPYTFPNCREIPEESFEMPEMPAREPDWCQEMKVTRRDMDTNGHTNNARYMDWASDTIPDEIYLKKTLRDIRITYKKECTRGMKIKIRTWQEGDTLISLFTDADDDSYVVGEIATIWT
ncbi:MAG: acyl-[acyl-carrier-protein] thioesterase [Anaerovoracaceae bacterium]